MENNHKKIDRLPTMARLGIVFLTWRRHLQRQLLPFNITLKQQFVLRQLERQEVLNPAEIADMLFCDRPTASVIINNLEKSGWVKRQKDPDNRKFILIQLTPKGKEKLKQLEQLPSDNLDPLNGLSSNEKCQLEELLIKLQDYLDRHIP